MKLLSKGAEADIFQVADKVKKIRTRKNYRLLELDEKLRKFRTRREAKIYQTLQKLQIPTPPLHSYSDKNMSLIIGHLSGQRLRDELNSANCQILGRELGMLIGKLHNNDIIHGDLTTSNMIFHNKKIHLIDFGLSFFSTRFEDKAVDLHLLKQTLEGSHPAFSKKCFAAFTAGYNKQYNKNKEVWLKFSKVEARGRYKGKS